MRVRRTSAGGERRHESGVRRLPVAAVGAATALTLLLTGCESGGGGAQPGPTLRSTPTASADKTALTFGVYGPKSEVDAFGGVVDDFNKSSQDSRVTLRSWSSHDAMMSDLRPREGSGTKVPDVFMVSRDDLAWLQAKKLNQPVDALLDERGVDFGDGYSRDALEAFAADNRLQCMPYAISPMVIYYNKDLVDFGKMRDRGLDAPDPAGANSRWSFDQFAAAADYAARPRKGTRGVYIDPTINGLAPFIYSGGGRVFADEDPPTSLAFSDDGTRSALDRTLQVLRDPHLTLTQRQLERRSALQWFERGRLGMIAGFRSLVPELRQVEGLRFDVMPMPVLDGSATVGDVTGLCISAKAASTPEAADFLADALSTQAVGRVVRAGYLVPTNLEVAASDDFLQAGQMPAHAQTFNTSVRSLYLPPLLDRMPALEDAVSGSLREMLNVPVLDLDALTEQIDAQSRPVLAPDTTSESPQ